MTTVQVLSLASIFFLVLCILHLRRNIRHKNAYDILSELGVSLEHITRNSCLNDDPVSIQLESKEEMDEILNDIRIAAESYGYGYSLKEYNPEFSEFILEKEGKKLCFRIHCLLPRHSNFDISFYYLSPY